MIWPDSFVVSDDLFPSVLLSVGAVSDGLYHGL
jgi:hypothetical protein